MRKKLVITGMGAISPIGLGVKNYWANLVNGVSGIRIITRFDTSRIPIRIAAEVRDFVPLWEKALSYERGLPLFMSFAMAAAEEALIQAGIKPHEDTAAIGVCMGTALGGAEVFCEGGAKYDKTPSGKISPHLVPRGISNMACAHLAIKWGFHGPGFTLSTACSAGGDALMTAALTILSGQANSMLVMAGESGINPVVLSSLAQAHALSRRNNEPERASRPFDEERDGFVIGEGGGAIFLETEEEAEKRGASILAELAGWANTLDGYHITAPDPSARWAALCMRKALQFAGLSPEDIDYINAHGTGTKLGDKAEAMAIAEVFGMAKKGPWASSTKGATGHLMSAGGLTEAIACIQAVRENILPPTLNLENPDPDCALKHIPLKAILRETEIAMSNSFGFGGQNSSIIIKRYGNRS